MGHRTFESIDLYTPSIIVPQVCSPCTTVNWNRGSLLTDRKFGAYDGQNTVGYAKIINDKKSKEINGTPLLPLNAYRRSDYLFHTDPGELSFTKRTYCGGAWRNCPFNIPLAIAPGPRHSASHSIVNLENPLTHADWLAYVTDALASMAPDLDALTSAAEARKTVEMVYNARQTAEDLYKQARSGGFRTAKAAAEAWLNWRYGWQLLGFDMFNIYEALANKKSLIVEGRAGTSEDSTSEEEFLSPQWDWGQVKSTYTGKSSVSIRANVVGRYAVGTARNYVANPLITGWELVPFSFVADWFITIGATLKAWDVLASLDEVHASMGFRQLVWVEGKTEVLPGYDPNITGASHYANSLERIEIRERVPVSIPFVLPTIRVRLSWKRLTDVAAFCGTRFIK